MYQIPIKLAQYFRNCKSYKFKIQIFSPSLTKPFLNKQKMKLGRQKHWYLKNFKKIQLLLAMISRNRIFIITNKKKTKQLCSFFQIMMKYEKIISLIK